MLARGAERHHGACQGREYSTRNSGETPRPWAGVPIPPSSPRPARHARLGATEVSRGGVRPWMLLAPALLSARSAAASIESDVLGTEARQKRRARCQRQERPGADGVARTHALGMSDRHGRSRYSHRPISVRTGSGAKRSSSRRPRAGDCKLLAATFAGRIAFPQGRFSRGATGPAGVTEEHLPGPKTAGFRMGRSPSFP